jgi:anti-anti-sigma factor
MSSDVGSPPVVSVVVRRESRVVWSGQVHRPDATIGRSPQCDIVLDHPGVAWIHAEITRDDGGALVFVDRSGSGSFRHGQPVRTARLGRGGIIEVPPFEIDLSIGPRSARPPAAEPPSSREEVAPPIASAAVRAEARILQAPGTLLGAVYPLAGSVVRIGRAPECDVCLDVPSVSRDHARLTALGDDRWTVVDVGSRNGLEVNGRLVREAEISFGDRLSIGPEVVLALHAAPVPEPDPAPDIERDPTVHTVTDSLVLRHAPSTLDARVTVFTATGRLDGYSYAYLREELATRIEAGQVFLIVDLSRCVYCDHAGLGVLVNAQVSLAARRGGLRLIGLSQQLRDAFLLLRLDQVLSVSEDEASAVAELTRQMK